jgi:outer membrane protein
MKKVTLILVMALMGLVSYAQDVQPVAAAQQSAFKFGFLSYDAALQSMPEYAEFQTNMTQLREKYEAEQQRVENDFNKKYEEFLDGQASYPKTILQKRQSELQEMLSKNIAFKKESLQLLNKAEAEAKAPLQQKLSGVLAKIGQERGFAFILNTDMNAVPWLNVEMGENITEAVEQLLK